MSHEKEVTPLPGFLMVIVGFVLFGVAIWTIILAEATKDPLYIAAIFAAWTAWIFVLPGFFIVEPNGSKVLILFGTYKGTVKANGFYWTIPFMIRRPVSLRTRTFNSEKLKVNDHVGNPIEIAAVIVWRVMDTYNASFEVDKYEDFVLIQSETAVRQLAQSYPYDADDATESLRRNTTEVSEHLLEQLQDRLTQAGVNVMEARLSHLAYAPEIAGAMLRRQQAAAVIAARAMIVDGAVGMVQMALRHLEEQHTVVLDDERKAAMVSNLLVVLCSEQAANPVINAGSLYQ